MLQFIKDHIGDRVVIIMQDGRRFDNVEVDRVREPYIHVDLRGMTGLSSSIVLHSDDIEYFHLA